MRDKMSVTKIVCKHLDQQLESHYYQEYHEGGGMDRDSSTSYSCLRCKGCKKTSPPLNGQYSNNYPTLDFERAYEQLTGRKLKTDDDVNQLNLLKVNPSLFWEFEPTNAKYLVPQVDAQWAIQDDLNKALEERTKALIKLKETEVKINKICQKGGRPVPYFARIY